MEVTPYESAARSLAYEHRVLLDIEKFRDVWFWRVSSDAVPHKHIHEYWQKNSDAIYKIFQSAVSELGKFDEIKKNPTEDNVFEGVKIVLEAVLGVDPEKIGRDSTLINDLGAESIDFLDVVFRLEQKFGIKIPRGDLFPEMFSITDHSFVKDGVVTEAGLAELRKRLPYADMEKFARNPKIQDVGDVFTIQMITNYLLKKLPKQQKE